MCGPIPSSPTLSSPIPGSSILNSSTSPYKDNPNHGKLDRTEILKRFQNNNTFIKKIEEHIRRYLNGRIPHLIIGTGTSKEVIRLSDELNKIFLLKLNLKNNYVLSVYKETDIDKLKTLHKKLKTHYETDKKIRDLKGTIIVPEMIGFYECKQKLYSLGKEYQMDLLTLMTTTKYFDESPDIKQHFIRIYNISKDFMSKLLILYNSGIGHRDLKLENIFINRDKNDKEIKESIFGDSDECVTFNYFDLEGNYVGGSLTYADPIIIVSFLNRNKNEKDIPEDICRNFPVGKLGVLFDWYAMAVIIYTLFVKEFPHEIKETYQKYIDWSLFKTKGNIEDEKEKLKRIKMYENNLNEAGYLTISDLQQQTKKKQTELKKNMLSCIKSMRIIKDKEVEIAKSFYVLLLNFYYYATCIVYDTEILSNEDNIYALLDYYDDEDYITSDEEKELIKYIFYEYFIINKNKISKDLLEEINLLLKDYEKPKEEKKNLCALIFIYRYIKCKEIIQEINEFNIDI